MMPENLAGMTGLAMGKKKTRRGKRRSASALSEHEAHLKAARECVQCGDHKGAKGALFKAIKALPNDEPEMEHNAAEEMREPEHIPKATASSKSARAESKLSPAMLAYIAKKQKAK